MKLIGFGFHLANSSNHCGNIPDFSMMSGRSDEVRIYIKIAEVMLENDASMSVRIPKQSMVRPNSLIESQDSSEQEQIHKF